MLSRWNKCHTILCYSILLDTRTDCSFFVRQDFEIVSSLVPAFLSVRISTVHDRISPAFSGLLTWVLWPKNICPVPRQALVSFVREAYCSPNSSDNLFGSWEGNIKSVENGHFPKTPNPMPQLAQLSSALWAHQKHEEICAQRPRDTWIPAWVPERDVFNSTSQAGV